MHTEKVFRAVLWADVTRAPDALSILRGWALSYADSSFSTENMKPDQIAAAVKGLLDDVINKRCEICEPSRVLVVLDDVWDSGLEAARLIQTACPDNATMLITTRSENLAHNMQARAEPLGYLSPEDAAALLAKYLLDADVTPLRELGKALGGNGFDAGYEIAVNSGSTYITGGTNSANFPTTAGAYQTVFNGGVDAFISKLDLISTLTHKSDTIGIFRPSTATFYLRGSNTQGFAELTVHYGATNSYPVVGDWTGASVTTLGVFDPTNAQFQLRNSNTPGAADETFVLGIAGDQPFAGRWQANAAHDGVGVFRPSNGLIYLKNELNSGFADYTMVLGIPGDVGVAGD